MTPSASLDHLILLVPPPMQSATIHYETFEGGHRSRTRLGQSPQLNWRLPTISRGLPKLRDSNKVPKGSKALSNNNRLGHSKYPRGQALGHSKYPRVTSFSTSTQSNPRGELKPMQPMQWQNTRSAQIVHSQIPPMIIAYL